MARPPNDSRRAENLDRKVVIMDLTEIYEKGEEFFRTKEYGRMLGYVETGFVRENDRRVIDRFTFRQKSIDAPDVSTSCRVLGVELSTPVIMSSMTMPIPAIADDALMQLARGLKAAGSLMWTGTPIPNNLCRNRLHRGSTGSQCEAVHR